MRNSKGEEVQRITLKDRSEHHHFFVQVVTADDAGPDGSLMVPGPPAGYAHGPSSSAPARNGLHRER